MRRYWLLILFLWIGCSAEDPNNKPIVKYKDAVLTVGMLKSMMPEGLSSADSARIATLMIDQWITDQVLVYEAQAKIPDLETKIQPMLQNYRNQLMIIELKKQYAQELNAKDIPEDTLKVWYEKKKSNFVAGQNYYQCYYIRTDRTDTPEIRKRLKPVRDKDFSIVKEWCVQYKAYHLLEEEWIDHQTFQKKIQKYLPTQNLSLLAPSPTVHFFITHNPKPTYHFFLMKAVIKAGEPLPFEMVKNQVVNLILHEKSNKGFEEHAHQMMMKVKNNQEVQFLD